MKVAERFADPSVQKSAGVDLAVIDRLDTVIGELELYLERTAKVDDVQTYHRLSSIPGVGKVLDFFEPERLIPSAQAKGLGFSRQYQVRP